MKNTRINGKEVDIVEHIKEIEQVCCNASLFKKWYNKKQLFKALLNQFKYVGCSDPDEEDDGPSVNGIFGTKSGCLVKIGNTCWFIELYKVEDLNPDKFAEIVDFHVDILQTAFFIQDDNKNVYLINTDID